jgi:hypothetical protein
MHYLGNKDEMPGGRNGQELGDALNQGDHDDLLDSHAPLALLVPRASRFYTEVLRQGDSFSVTIFDEAAAE